MKIGDKVRIVNDPDGVVGHRIGHVGVITDIATPLTEHDEEGAGPVYTVEVPETGLAGAYYASDLEAVSVFEDEVTRVYTESRELLLSKHRDYGPKNIAASPGGPLMGLAVRLHDKIARLAHLLETGATPEHESVQDTFRDIMGYGAIGVLVCEGHWPGEERR